MASLIRYLEQAARTALGMWNVSRWYSQMGLMVGSVYLEVCCASASVRGAPDGLLMTTDRRSDCASLIRCCAIWSVMTSDDVPHPLMTSDGLPHQVLRDLEREGNPLASQVREVMFNRMAIH